LWNFGALQWFSTAGYGEDLVITDSLKLREISTGFWEKKKELFNSQNNFALYLSHSVWTRHEISLGSQTF